VAFDPHYASLYGLQHSVYVRFSLLALSSIFFLVDPFAALPTFLAITEGADPARRRRIARKGARAGLLGEPGKIVGRTRRQSELHPLARQQPRQRGAQARSSADDQRGVELHVSHGKPP